MRELLDTESFVSRCGLSLGIKDKTFVVQGFGAVGYWASKFIEKDGGLITTVIEYNSAIHNPAGLDVEKVKAFMVEHGTLASYPDATEAISDNPQAFLLKHADCMIPAATEKSLHAGNAEHIMVKAIFEGANGPTTYAAEQIFTRRGIVAAPDMLVNGGGVTCSYFEWLKNLDHVAPGRLTKKYQEKSQMQLLKLMGIEATNDQVQGANEIDIVYSGLEEIMTSAVRENWAIAVDRNLTYRNACFVNAIGKVHASLMETGIMI